jgi:leucyl/phenylalanyl-tRNA---protein transferase
MGSDGLTPEILLRAYSAGVFPMAEARDDPGVFWVDPHSRGIIPLMGFRVSRSLRRRILSGVFDVTVDRAFRDVVRGCASRPETWINHRIEALYQGLYRMGRAHSMEVWRDGRLAGGVYGVALGGAFFGESMFSRESDASKVALCYLVDRVRCAGFTLFDTQFVTDHLLSLGAVEIPRDVYHGKLAEALQVRTDFDAPGRLPSPQALMQRMTQTS